MRITRFYRLMQNLERVEKMMVQWIYGVPFRDRLSSAELYRRLSVESIIDVVRQRRLRWFGHLERKCRID